MDRTPSLKPEHWVWLSHQLYVPGKPLYLSEPLFTWRMEIVSYHVTLWGHVWKSNVAVPIMSPGHSWNHWITRRKVGMRRAGTVIKSAAHSLHAGKTLCSLWAFPQVIFTIIKKRNRPLAIPVCRGETGVGRIRKLHKVTQLGSVPLNFLGLLKQIATNWTT